MKETYYLTPATVFRVRARSKDDAIRKVICWVKRYGVGLNLKGAGFKYYRRTGAVNQVKIGK